MRIILWVNMIIIYGFFAFLMWLNYPDEIRNLLASVSKDEEFTTTAAAPNSSLGNAKNGTVFDVIQAVNADLLALQTAAMPRIRAGQIPLFFTDSFDLTLQFKVVNAGKAGFKLAVLEAGAEVSNQRTDSQSITLHFKTPLSDEVRGFIADSCDEQTSFYDPNLSTFCAHPSQSTGETDPVGDGAETSEESGGQIEDIAVGRTQDDSQPSIGGGYFMTNDQVESYRNLLSNSGYGSSIIDSLLSTGDIKIVDDPDILPQQRPFSDFLNSNRVVANQQLLSLGTRLNWASPNENLVGGNPQILDISPEILEAVSNIESSNQ